MYDGFSVSKENSREEEKGNRRKTKQHLITKSEMQTTLEVTSQGMHRKLQLCITKLYRIETLQNWKQNFVFQQYKEM